MEGNLTHTSSSLLEQPSIGSPLKNVDRLQKHLFAKVIPKVKDVGSTELPEVSSRKY
jgi:hypothetical protein